MRPSSFFFSHFLSPGGHFPLYIIFLLILVIHLLIMQVIALVPVPFDAFLNLL